MEKYIDRLFQEWKQHRKIIIAVDYDDTISPWKLETEESIQRSGIFQLLKDAQYTGAYII